MSFPNESLSKKGEKEKGNENMESQYFKEDRKKCSRNKTEKE